MAVLAELELPGARDQQIYGAEALVRARAEALGRPPLTGCMFAAVVPFGAGFRMVTVWRTRDDFASAYADILAPDLAEVGVVVDDVSLAPVVVMSIPGAQA